MTFDDLRHANLTRLPDFGHYYSGGTSDINSWSPTDWACALAGEVGELCNLVKKMRRGEAVAATDIHEEIADVQTYLDLLAARLGVNLEIATRDKFNKVSNRVGSRIRL